MLSRTPRQEIVGHYTLCEVVTFMAGDKMLAVSLAGENQVSVKKEIVDLTRTEALNLMFESCAS